MECIVWVVLKVRVDGDEDESLDDDEVVERYVYIDEGVFLESEKEVLRML